MMRTTHQSRLLEKIYVQIIRSIMGLWCTRTLLTVEVLLGESCPVDIWELELLAAAAVVPPGRKLMSVKGMAAATVGHPTLLTSWGWRAARCLLHHSWHKGGTGCAWGMELRDRGTATDALCSWLRLQVIAPLPFCLLSFLLQRLLIALFRTTLYIFSHRLILRRC
jgi:hypothetical protein